MRQWCVAVKMQNPGTDRGFAKNKQLRWLDHAIFGILVNIRYQIENPNSSTTILTAAHIALKNFYVQYQKDGELSRQSETRRAWNRQAHRVQKVYTK
jgi:hypothetical protein